MSKRYTVALSIGGVVLSVESRNKLFIDLIRYGFRGFIASGKRINLKVDVTIDDSMGTNVYSNGRPHYLRVVPASGKFFVRGSGYRGVFDVNSRTAILSQSLAVAPFYLFLRFMMSVYLPLVGGFMLHSNSIVNNGKGFLFSGKPESGKSTVARLSSDRTILSDDFSIVRKKDGAFYVFGSPFWGRVEARGKNVRGELGCAPVKGIYFLCKDVNVRVEEIDRKEALLQVFQNMAFLVNDRDVNTRLICLSDEFVRKVNCGILHFKLDNSFWRCIEND